MRRFAVDPDIRRAATPPGWVYTCPEFYARCVRQVMARSWQLVADRDAVRVPGQVHPFLLLPGCLDEPLLLTRDFDDRLHCVSNVCTHRAALVCEHPGNERSLRCRYHGRRFALDGRFESMPEFEQAVGFPSPTDDLAAAPFGAWERFVFAGLAPAIDLEAWLRPVRDRIGWMPLSQFTPDASASRDYLVRCNWALYCENYLEGFHVPYVHPELTAALDYSAYRTELFEWGSVQIGVAKAGEDCFDLPADSPDRGQRIAGYYFWLFPTTMLNFYPWGLSINLVQPLGVDRTRVRFLAYVWDAARRGVGAGAQLDRVEREDEAGVESCQVGLRSRLYRHGRYSPTRETGTHHFHGLLAAATGGD